MISNILEKLQNISFQSIKVWKISHKIKFGSVKFNYIFNCNYKINEIYLLFYLHTFI
jgi:hypothetical protein